MISDEHKSDSDVKTRRLTVLGGLSVLILPFLLWTLQLIEQSSRDTTDATSQVEERLSLTPTSPDVLAFWSERLGPDMSLTLSTETQALQIALGDQVIVQAERASFLEQPQNLSKLTSEPLVLEQHSIFRARDVTVYGQYWTSDGAVLRAEQLEVIQIREDLYRLEVRGGYWQEVGPFAGRVTIQYIGAPEAFWLNMGRSVSLSDLMVVGGTLDMVPDSLSASVRDYLRKAVMNWATALTEKSPPDPLAASEWRSVADHLEATNQSDPTVPIALKSAPPEPVHFSRLKTVWDVLPSHMIYMLNLTFDHARKRHSDG